MKFDGNRMNSKIVVSMLFCVVSVLVFSSAGASAQTVKLPVKRTSTVRGDSYAYKLTDQDFANTPSWNSDEGEPPLSVSQAIKAARENLPRFVHVSESWKVRMVTLQSMGEEKWYYRIHFFCHGITCREIEDRSFTAIVKMNGMIVEPKKVTIEN